MPRGIKIHFVVVYIMIFIMLVSFAIYSNIQAKSISITMNKKANKTYVDSLSIFQFNFIKIQYDSIIKLQLKNYNLIKMIKNDKKNEQR